MAENFESDIDTEKTKLLFEKMEEIQKMENQFNKLGLVYEGIPIEDLSPAQVEQIKRKILVTRRFFYVFNRILVFVLAKLSSSIFYQKFLFKIYFCVKNRLKTQISTCYTKRRFL